MNNPPKRTYRQSARAASAQALRERILDAFFGILAVEDYDRVTLDDLAMKAGTTRQTVLRLFGSKDGALTALLYRSDESVSSRRLLNCGSDLAALATATVADLEVVGDFVIQLLRKESQIPAVAQRFSEARAEHMQLLRTNLSPLVRHLDAEEAELAILQARAVTDTSFWHILRHELKLDRHHTERMMLSFLKKIFAEPA